MHNGPSRRGWLGGMLSGLPAGRTPTQRAPIHQKELGVDLFSSIVQNAEECEGARYDVAWTGVWVPWQSLCL